MNLKNKLYTGLLVTGLCFAGCFQKSSNQICEPIEQNSIAMESRENDKEMFHAARIDTSTQYLDSLLGYKASWDNTRMQNYLDSLDCIHQSERDKHKSTVGYQDNTNYNQNNPPPLPLMYHSSE
jgi:hypothetical protein